MAAPSRSPAHSLAPWEQSWRAERWLRRLMKERPIDLIWRMHPFGALPYRVPTYGKPLVIGPIFYAWPATVAAQSRTGKPRLGIGLEPLVRPILERGWRRSLRDASLVICATPHHAEALQSAAPAARMLALPVVVNPPPGALRRPSATGAAMRPLRLIFVANLHAYKNPAIFCEIVRCLRERGLPAEGRLIGDGPQRQTLEATCAGSGMGEWIRFAGQLPNERIWGELQEADFLVSTSLGEPYGRSIAEAMAVGTPAVCHRSGGPAEFIEDGQTGLLIDQLCANAFADAIARTWLQPELMDRLSRNAAAVAVNWSASRVITLLEEALDRAGGTPRESCRP
jgi:glycosyltransferase involved in cell wall biosynthesis